MNCPNCRTVNPEGAKFCLNCGMPLSTACPHCGTTLAPGAKFCFNCGQAVVPSGGVASPATAQAAPDPAMARLQQYIPPELLRKLEAARDNRTMEGERRIVTVLFSDVKSSTSMAETLDPEEWAEIMNGAFKYLIAPVYHYEGTLARLMGDAVLAFFGAPVAHEDDPMRAILAALDMLEGIKPYREQVKRRYGLELNLRVGINTGLVVVGEMGSDLRVEYTAMGDAVNLASRMEQRAEPGTVQITGGTYKSVSNLFDFESLGEIEVRGKSEPVEAYRVLRRRAGAVPTRGIEGLNSPMVGRERELNLLQGKVGDLLTGSGNLVSIMGEAGLGKSRLLSELKKSLPQSPDPSSPLVRWHEGRSLSYETAAPYAPFVHLLTGLFSLQPEDTAEVKYGKIRSGIDEILPGYGGQLGPYIASMLEVPATGEDADKIRFIEPPQLRAGIFFSLETLLAQLASIGPLVLVFEDLHWADPSSLELLGRLLPVTDRAALMIIALFRPQRQDPSWIFHEAASRDYPHRYTQITLEPLDEQHSRTLVANLLEIEDLPESVRALILRKAEGNPFFVEEVIRSLLDGKLVVREGEHWRATREIANITVPDTLVGVITARLDRLDEDSKHVAQTAAVIGREFWLNALSDVYEEPAAVGPSLSTLQRRELVRERDQVPDRTYAFKHVLTQETAYSSILLSHRRELHRRVAECLERLAPGHVNDIARNFLEAREEARALPYLLESGDRATRAGAPGEAAGYYSKALDILEETPDAKLARRAFEGLGKAFEFQQNIPGAMENYHKMLHYAENHEDNPMKVSALNKISYLNGLMMGQFPEAEKHLQDAEQLARESNDIAGLAEMFTIRCGICTATADFDGAVKYLAETVDLGRKIDSPAQTAYGLAHISNTYTFLTRFDEAWARAEEGLRVARAGGFKDREAEILTFPLPVGYLRRGDSEAALRAVQDGIDLAARIGTLFPQVLGLFTIGLILQMRGEYERAIEACERAVETARPLFNFLPFATALPLGTLGAILVEISPALAGKAKEYHAQAAAIMQTPGGSTAAASAWSDIGQVDLLLGDLDGAEEALQKALTIRSYQMVMMRPRIQALMGLLALSKGNVDEAARLVSGARAFVDERSMKYMYPAISLVEARVREAGGDIEGALAHLESAEKAAAEMQFRPALWQAQVSAARILSSLGRESEASDKRRQARAVVDEIAGMLKNEQHRVLFLQHATAQLDSVEAASSQ